MFIEHLGYVRYWSGFREPIMSKNPCCFQEALVKKAFIKITIQIHKHLKTIFWGFPGGTVVKNPPANAGDTGSSPGPGRSHMPRSN